MSDALTPTPAAPRGISRRTVAAGAAWAVPAVLFAGAAPALAASPVIDGEFTYACKYPGGSVNDCKFSYRTETIWSNSHTGAIDVTFSFEATWAGASLVRILVDGEELESGATVTVPAGGSVAIVFIASGSNAANTEGSVSVTGSYTHNGNPYSPSVSEYFTETPPCEYPTPDCFN